MVEGSGVIVEAVACDGACTADTHGIGNGNNSDNGHGNGNGCERGDGTGNKKWFTWIIDLATCSAAAEMS